MSWLNPIAPVYPIPPADPPTPPVPPPVETPVSKLNPRTKPHHGQREGLLHEPAVRVILVGLGLYGAYRMWQDWRGTQQVALPPNAIPPDAQPYVDASLTDCADYLGVAPSAITVSSVRQVTWPDSSLGAGVPGYNYEPHPTPGWAIILTLANNEIRYAADMVGTVVRQVRGRVRF